MSLLVNHGACAIAAHTTFWMETPQDTPCVVPLPWTLLRLIPQGAAYSLSLSLLRLTLLPPCDHTMLTKTSSLLPLCWCVGVPVCRATEGQRHLVIGGYNNKR